MRVHVLSLAAVCLCAALLPLAAQADGVQPGLWELHSKLQFTKGGPQFSPEDLDRMKTMGIDPFADAVVQRCVTPDQAATEFDFGKTQPPGDDGCSVQNPKRSGGSYSGEYVCDGEIKGRGEFKATVTPTGFSGMNSLAGYARGAEPGHDMIEMRSDFSGKFIKADCGSVSP